MFKELKFFPSKLSCTAKPRDITLVTFPHHLPSIKEFRKGIRQKRKCFTPEQQTTLSLHSHFHVFFIKVKLTQKEQSHRGRGTVLSFTDAVLQRQLFSIASTHHVAVHHSHSFHNQSYPWATGAETALGRVQSVGQAIFFKYSFWKNIAEASSKNNLK